MGVENMSQVPIGASIVDGLKAGREFSFVVFPVNFFFFGRKEVVE